MNLTSPALLERPTPPTLDKRSVEELRSEPPRPLGPQDGPALRLTPLVAVVVALAALMAFAGTLAFEFVWDDTLLIQRSYQLHDWRDLWPALATHFWAEVQEASHYYRPFITFTFFLDLQVWGLNPLGFHLTNVLAHLATSLAVLALAWRLTRRRVAAGGAGVLFALHPLHSESVAFVSGRTDIFATLFFLMAVLGYARWRDTGRPLWAAGSLAAFFLALASKEVAVVLPLVLALYDWARDRPGLGGRALAPTIARCMPYAGVIGLYAWLRLLAIGGLTDSDGPAWAPLIVRALTGIKIVAWYAWLALVPFPANAYYPIVPVTPPPPAVWWLAVGFLVAVIGLVAVAVRRWPVVAFGALWFAIALIPSAGVNFLPLSAPIMAERFLYLPSVGFCIAAGAALRPLLGDLERTDAGRARQVKAYVALPVMALLVTYAVLTLSRNEDWKDDYRLYLRMVETSPEAALPHVNLGLTQIQRGQVAPAREHLQRAVEILPKNPRALVSLALAQTVLGERDEGLRNALRAYAYAPKNPNVLSTVGAVYLYRSEPAPAAVHLQDSLRLNPNQVNAVFNLALALAKLGRQEEAERTLERGLALSALMSPGNGWGYRVAAEIHGPKDPARAREWWARYIASVRSAPEQTDQHRADVVYAERQIERSRGAVR